MLAFTGVNTFRPASSDSGTVAASTLGLGHDFPVQTIV
jgi:hypothetical protein